MWRCIAQLCLNNEADRRSLAAVLSNMEQHFIGTMNVTYERFVFRTRTQGQGETFEQYLLAHRTLVKTCNFQAMLEDVIRDQLVCGITKKSLRKSLLKRKHLGLSVCIDICQAAERSAQQSMLMAGHEEIHAMRQSVRRTSMPQAKPKAIKKTCGYCGQHHVKGKFPAFGHECTACEKKNHYAGVCRNMRRTKVNWTRQESDEESEHLMTLTPTEEINAVQHSVYPRQLFAYMEVKDQRVRFQLDLGSSCNVIRRQDLVPTVVLEKTNQILCLYNQSQVRPLGKCLVNMNNPKTHTKYKANLVVLDNASTSLLGASSIQQMDLVRIQHEIIMAATIQVRCQDKVNSTNTHMFGQDVSQKPVQLPDLLQDYKDVFDGSLEWLGTTSSRH